MVVSHHSFWCDEREIDWTFPIHIPITLSALAVSSLSIGSLRVNSPFAIGKVFPVANNRDNGNGVIVGCLDIRPCYGNTWQITFLEQTETKVCRIVDGKCTGFTYVAYQPFFRIVCFPRNIIEIEVVFNSSLFIEIESNGLNS